MARSTTKFTAFKFSEPETMAVRGRMEFVTFTSGTYEGQTFVRYSFENGGTTEVPESTSQRIQGVFARMAGSSVVSVEKGVREYA